MVTEFAELMTLKNCDIPAGAGAELLHIAIDAYTLTVGFDPETGRQISIFRPPLLRLRARMLPPQMDYFSFRANGVTTGTLRVSVGIVFHARKW
jgi:hypothetical protein